MTSKLSCHLAWCFSMQDNDVNNGFILGAFGGLASTLGRHGSMQPKARAPLNSKMVERYAKRILWNSCNHIFACICSVALSQWSCARNTTCQKVPVAVPFGKWLVSLQRTNTMPLDAHDNFFVIVTFLISDPYFSCLRLVRQTWQWVCNPSSRGKYCWRHNTPIRQVEVVSGV